MCHDVADRVDGLVRQALALVAGQVQLNVGGLAVNRSFFAEDFVRHVLGVERLGVIGDTTGDRRGVV